VHALLKMRIGRFREWAGRMRFTEDSPAKFL